MRISPSHSFYSCAAHDEVLEQWAQVENEPGPLELDLTRVSFFDPYGLVGLVLFLNHLPEHALPVRLTLEGFPPVKGDASRGERSGESAVVAYLTRMGFWEEVGEKLDHPSRDLPVRPMWSSDKNVLIDVTILHGRDAIGVMLRKTGDILQSLNFTPIGRGHCLEVLSELSGNVLDHAQSDFGGVVATQTYRSRHSGVRYLVMSIGDMGIGVRSSLSGNDKLAGRLESDAVALGVAVQMGNSRFGSGGRGGGLPRVLDIARKYGGSVALRSGRGALAYKGDTDERRVFEGPIQTGTQLRIMLPENRLLNQ